LAALGFEPKQESSVKVAAEGELTEAFERERHGVARSSRFKERSDALSRVDVGGGFGMEAVHASVASTLSDALLFNEFPLFKPSQSVLECGFGEAFNGG